MVRIKKSKSFSGKYAKWIAGLFIFATERRGEKRKIFFAVLMGLVAFVVIGMKEEEKYWKLLKIFS